MELTEKIMETIWASGSGQQSKAENRGEPDQLWKGKEDFFFQSGLLWRWASCRGGPDHWVLISRHCLKCY